MKWTSLLLCSIVSVCLSCRGQNNALTMGETVTEMSRNIWVTFQDNNGDYWFGSNGDGVYHYDGRLMLRYSTKDGLCNDSVREIKEDGSGNLFFNTCGGVSKFDGKKFTTLTVVKTKVWKLEPEDLWFTGNQDENGPYRYDGKFLYNLDLPKHYLEEDFYRDMPNPPYNPYQVYTIYKDSKGNAWFGTSTFGIYRYDGKFLSNMYEDRLTHIGENGSFGIRSIIEDKDGMFWFCNTRYRYSISQGDSIGNGYRFINYQREPGIPNAKDAEGRDRIYYQSVAEDKHGDLWMQTWGQGIWRYDGNEMHHYPVKEGTKVINIYSMYQDKRGGLWLNTPEHGAYKFNGKTFEPWPLD